MGILRGNLFTNWPNQIFTGKFCQEHLAPINFSATVAIVFNSYFSICYSVWYGTYYCY